MGLKLVHSAAQTTKSAPSLLQVFMSTELEPGLTIETACYPSMVLFEMRVQPEPMQLAQGRVLLRQAGLLYLEMDAFEHGYILVDDEKLFLRRFPHLAAVVPLLKQVKGVLVCSGAAALEPLGLALVPAGT